MSSLLVQPGSSCRTSVPPHINAIDSGHLFQLGSVTRRVSQMHFGSVVEKPSVAQNLDIQFGSPRLELGWLPGDSSSFPDCDSCEP
jgi:hypothetical protein